MKKTHQLQNRFPKRRKEESAVVPKMNVQYVGIIKEVNHEELKCSYESINWEIFENIVDLEEQVTVTTDFINELKRQSTTTFVYYEDYYTGEVTTTHIKHARRKREQAFKNCDDISFKYWSKKVSCSIAELNGKILVQLKNLDCKQYWISIKSAANYNNNKSRHGLSNNKKIDLDKLNNHFLRFEDNNKHQIPQTCTEPVGDEYPVLDENIIKSLITKLSKSDSPGPDGLTSQTLKIFKHQLHNPVRFILNKCLCLGKIPQSWKKVKIIPIPKGGRKTIKEVADARPIGLTSSFLKLLEHYLKQFVNVLVSDQLDSNQFAYKEHRGTQDAIALLINQTQCFLDEKDTIVRILFLDFSSAFNTVSRQELLDIIKNRFLAPNWLINILLSYLDERIQYVSFGKDKSKEVGCRAGVIQGAVLSPLFFTLVTDSLTSNSNYNNFYRVYRVSCGEKKEEANLDKEHAEDGNIAKDCSCVKKGAKKSRRWVKEDMQRKFSHLIFQ
ncbi:RNA-directed DNA polymerase from mobile element jockey [Nymphon striatum]|nr:RNA-directed DNA polymerase from mobile element jockey [Nymphon striatum]